ncbi:MAG: hypothetical protein AAGC83_15085 [Pseudomonadota bacterium]
MDISIEDKDISPPSKLSTANDAVEILIDGVAAANVSDGIVRMSVYARRYDPESQTSRPTIVANLVMGRNAMQQMQNAMQQLLTDRMSRSSDAKPPPKTQ